MANPIVRAAVVQAAPVIFDTPRTIAKLVDLTEQAAGQGAEIVVFPEAFVGGYPKGLDFGARLGMRSAEGREDFRRYYESAITVPGQEMVEIGDVARRNRLHLVVGVIERDGGTLYCTALMFGPDGSLFGKHRKLMPTALERLVWGFGDGSTITVVDSGVGRFGSVICWENYMPLLRTAMYAKGIEIYCAPTVDDRETWLPTMRTIALEGRCFVLSACQYLTRADCPAAYNGIQGDDPSTVLSGAVPASSIRSGRSWWRQASRGRSRASPISTAGSSRGENTIWTWWAITQGQMCSISLSIRGRRVRFPSQPTR